MPAPAALAADDRQADHRPLGLRLLAFAREQSLQAETHLGREGEDLHEGVHEARKCIRRVRATLALGAQALGPRAKRLDAELRRLCRGLSHLRNAQAFLEALARLDGTVPPTVQAILPGVERIARERRDHLLARALARDPIFAARRRRLWTVHERLARLDWQSIDAAGVSEAVNRSKRRARKAMKKALKKRDDELAWHTCRRRIRRLRQQDTLLSGLQPDLSPAMHRLASRADALGESQDNALLLHCCGKRSPFGIAQRKLLRQVARERLQHLRANQARGA